MSIGVFSAGVFSLPVASPVFDSVRLFALNKTGRHNGSTKITARLYTERLSLAKGIVEKFTNAQYEIENLEIYVTVARRKKKKQINTFIMFS